MSDPIVEAVGLRYERGGRAILTGFDIRIERGESVAVVGPSGSGKSTLLALLAGLEQADAGTVRTDVADDEVGLILQGHGLVSLLTAAENVALPLQGQRTVRSRAEAALQEVGLGDVREHLVESLSGGQQERVAVARALVTRPRLVLADEPTAALDRDSRDLVIELLLALPASGSTVVIATHDLAVAERVDRVVRISG